MRPRILSRFRTNFDRKNQGFFIVLATILQRICQSSQNTIVYLIKTLNFSIKVGSETWQNARTHKLLYKYDVYHLGQRWYRVGVLVVKFEDNIILRNLQNFDVFLQVHHCGSPYSKSCMLCTRTNITFWHLPLRQLQDDGSLRLITPRSSSFEYVFDPDLLSLVLFF